jgi:hypothetical protein
MPTTGRGGLHDCETLSIPHCLHSRLKYGGEVARLTRRQVWNPKPSSLYVSEIRFIALNTLTIHIDIVGDSFEDELLKVLRRKMLTLSSDWL